MAGTQTPQTGIQNADELLTLAAAFGLTVTVESTDRESFTAHVVRIAIPVPVAYAGTELGRAIEGETLTMLWTRPNKGGRGRLEDATAWDVTSHRKVRTLRAIRAHVETMGRSSTTYARETSPLPDDVVDAPHALHIDGKLRKEGIPADRVRTFVKNRRFNGLHTHQDTDGTIVCDNRRYVPVTPQQNAGSPADTRQHVRIVNGGAPALIPTRDALAEMNHAMMDGKKDVREMSEARGHARIVYKDRERGTVTLRPATPDDLAPVAARPAADVLAADPIPADASVLDGMPGREITRQELRTPADVLTHTEYVVQLRDAGIWTLPNHDDGSTMTRGQVAHALRRTLDSAPDRARTTRDDDGTVYLSTGRQAARYIPAARIADHSADLCPGCGTPYATNGDGPCTGGRSTVKEQPAPAAPAPVADTVPLFAALAAYEATLFCTSPRDLDDLARHLHAVGKAAPTAHHREILAAQADVIEGAWEALRTAGNLRARNAANDQARAAVDRAREVILTVAPHAHRMHGTDVPGTAEEIRAAAVAYNAVGRTAEELPAIETGTPQVRVHCTSDSGTGWHVTATIAAGIDTPRGFIPAHPAIVVNFRKRDGRQDAAANARRVFGALFRVDVPVEYVTDRRP
ncbi:hypothetical protein SEA_GILGAMESH_124 [Streptomyces phage Gilgamesh]|uniref:Uncharacterized protein n=1 Tax=Streptomyces phage Gilgamesh TaxID=2599890 RepID=A0A5J6TR79_9CAUD|nr:hypothetical protein QEH35_gp124 [Streptomyces phage Gilgamesh]QFG13316.1 hypothetical protein SEA_GILGAMESH_124 [Streptomyces phage Gilgamesh]